MTVHQVDAKAANICHNILHKIVSCSFTFLRSNTLFGLVRIKLDEYILSCVNFIAFEITSVGNYLESFSSLLEKETETVLRFSILVCASITLNKESLWLMITVVKILSSPIFGDPCLFTVLSSMNSKESIYLVYKSRKGAA